MTEWPKGARWGRTPRIQSKPKRCQPANVMHQSTLEARRCTELQLMEKGGLIRNLRAHPQVRFRLDVEGQHICDYLADFCYFDVDRDCEVVEDTKGHITEISRMKLKLMAAVHGVNVELVRSSRGRGWR